MQSIVSFNMGKGPNSSSLTNLQGLHIPFSQTKHQTLGEQNLYRNGNEYLREREEWYLGNLGVREEREEVGAKGSLRRLESLMFEAVVDLGCQCLSHQRMRLRTRLSGHPFFLSFFHSQQRPFRLF